ncbi:hypothetical protein MKW92_037724, partial [Papaver armeniacum]
AVKKKDVETDNSADEDDGKSEVLDDGSHGVKLKDGEGNISGSGLVVNCGGESSSPGDESGTREDIVCEAEVHVKRNGSVESKSGSDIQIVHESPTVSNLETGSSFVSNAVVAEANGSAEEAAVASENNSDLENPLDWDDFDSAVEIQVLGLERLKAELRAHGLKCGGMLQELVSRLFLNTSTWTEMWGDVTRACF